MIAKVDKDLCIGCGLCPSVCPEVFEMDDDGKAEVISADIPNNVESEAKEATAGCPVNAIEVL